MLARDGAVVYCKGKDCKRYMFSSEGIGYDSPYSVGTGWECSNLLNGTFEY